MDDQSLLNWYQTQLSQKQLLVRKFYNLHEKPSPNSDTRWYAISKSWLDSFLDKDTADPGKILNKGLMSQDWNGISRHLKEHETHEWICEKQWSLLVQHYKCEEGIFGRRIFYNDKTKSMYAYSLLKGDNISVKVIFVDPNSNWLLNWQIERIIWIAHLKNDNCKNCYLSQNINNNFNSLIVFPKHLITYILSFLNKKFDKKYCKLNEKKFEKIPFSNKIINQYKSNYQIYQFPKSCTVREIISYVCYVQYLFCHGV